MSALPALAVWVAMVLPDGCTRDAAPGAADGAGGVGVADAADGRPVSVVTVYEGQGCSTNPEDDPRLVCSSVSDLFCITTHSIVVVNPAAALSDGGVRPVYVCRVPCVPGVAACPSAGDVCCAGTVAGGGSATACVPAGNCDSIHDGGAG
jgi:hypothetical protein